MLLYCLAHCYARWVETTLVWVQGNIHAEDALGKTGDCIIAKCRDSIRLHIAVDKGRVAKPLDGQDNIDVRQESARLPNVQRLGQEHCWGRSLGFSTVSCRLRSSDSDIDHDHTGRFYGYAHAIQGRCRRNSTGGSLSGNIP